MLVLSRKTNEDIIIRDAADNVVMVLKVCHVGEGRVKLGVAALEGCRINRREVDQKKFGEYHGPIK